MQLTGLPPRSGDLAVIEHLNGHIKRRVNADLAKKFPTGLIRNKKNIKRWKNYVKKSITKHTRNTNELKAYCKSLVNAVKGKNQLLVQRNGGPLGRR